MIYVTGDVHGELKKFSSSEIRKLRKNDYLIICGDFGFIWNGNREEKSFLRKIGKKKFTTLFIEGAHDNYALIESYPLVDFCGGKARSISGRLYYLERGHVFDIDGKTVFAFGGGDDESLDINLLPDGKNLKHLPSYDDMKRAATNLKAHSNCVDYIVTHDCNFNIRSCFVSSSNSNHLHALFDTISKTCTFKKWFFGCYHKDKIVSPSYCAVYDKILPLE